MNIQRLTRTHFAGEPLEQQAIYFESLSGFRYRLTHYEIQDGLVLWLHGYDERDGIRFYTSRTPDELTAQSLVGLS